MMSEVAIREEGGTETSCGGDSANEAINLNERQAGLERSGVNTENPSSAKTESTEYSESEVTKGFISALENMAEDEIPAYVKQHDSTLTFPEKVGSFRF
jgi:hypothetical protein